MRGRSAGGSFRPDVEGLRAVAVVAVVLYHAGFLDGGFVGVDIFFVVSGFLITRLLWTELEATGHVSFAAFYGRRARRLLPAAVLVLVATVAAASLLQPPLRARAVVDDARAVAVYLGNHRFASLETDYLGADGAPSPLLHYWSLAVEEQFYVLWPAVIAAASLAWRRSSRRPSATAAAIVVAALGASSFALCAHLTAVSQPWAFFSLPTRAWELAAGALVALLAPRLQRVPDGFATLAGWAGLLTVGWSVTQLSSAAAFPGTVAAVPVLGTAVLIAAGGGAPSSASSRLLALRPLQQLGHISYSWYLWHWPALVLVPVVVGRPLTPWENLAVALAAAVVAAATVHLVENPMRFSPTLVAEPVRSLALGATLTAVALLAAGLAAVRLVPSQGDQAAAAPAPVAAETTGDIGTHPVGQEDSSGATSSVGQGSGPPPGDDADTNGSAPPTTSAAPVPPAQAAVAGWLTAGVAVDEVPSNLDPPVARAHGSVARVFDDGCNNTYREAAVHRCEYGSSGGDATVILFGDSHAAHWFPAVERIATERGWRLISLTKSTCPPVSLSIWSPVLARPFRECDEWRDAIVRRVADEHAALVIVGAARHYGPEYRFDVTGPEWSRGLGDMVARLRTTGAEVAVLSPTPKPTTNIPECLSDHVHDAVRCTQPLATAVDGGQVAREATAVRASGGSYVDVTPLICAAETCPVIVGNVLVYRDDNHLTTPFVTWLAPALAEAMDAAVAGQRTASPPTTTPP